MKKILIMIALCTTALLTTGTQAADDKNVVVYGHTGCPWTVKTLKYLDKSKIKYTLRDVKNDDDANREFYSKGYKKIPQVVIAGESEVSGWRKGTLKKLLIQHQILAE